MRGPMKYTNRTRTGWTAELLVMFVSDFLLATMLCLALWFFQLKPAQAAALRAKEGALQAKETAFLNCLAEKNQCSELKDKIQAENGEINAKLKEALVGWARCIRSKNAPNAQEKPKGNNP